MLKNTNAEVSNLSFTAKETIYAGEQYFAGIISPEMIGLQIQKTVPQKKV